MSFPCLNTCDGSYLQQDIVTILWHGTGTLYGPFGQASDIPRDASLLRLSEQRVGPTLWFESLTFPPAHVPTLRPLHIWFPLCGPLFLMVLSPFLSFLHLLCPENLFLKFRSHNTSGISSAPRPRSLLPYVRALTRFFCSNSRASLPLAPF